MQDESLLLTPGFVLVSKATNWALKVADPQQITLHILFEMSGIVFDSNIFLHNVVIVIDEFDGIISTAHADDIGPIRDYVVE